ncbi:nitrous oxide reductase accessory protein NosL [Natronomonas sp. F2-12]|jgi:nitrous oxide reductase accessory protein NosL|uniref:Nitrous oxide reductase accessory protein NosL n=1 Tax=Natronomonas aquatica TaxID=2841590 RepID=A0A9R1CNI3_9EURY|nr:nitrous oxide reductase accessory protein NosL [Natronomonas aquatica]MCQ4332044.1 nitrous oxide reductase accessory protein NosL [Natronomonas aquatica]
MDSKLLDTADRTRRTILTTVAVGGIGMLAGCLGGDGEGPDPVSLDQGQSCDYCNMRIEMHPGPVGEAFYGGDAPPSLPEDRENGIARFCSSSCTYNYLLENEEQGHEPQIAYGTDYSSVDYELTDDSGTTVISAHLSAEAFAELQDLNFVTNSDVEGAMGSSLIGFTDADDAAAFADEHGGEILTHDDITREVLSGLSA